MDKINFNILREVAEDIRNNPQGFNYWKCEKCIMGRIGSKFGIQEGSIRSKKTLEILGHPDVPSSENHPIINFFFELTIKDRDYRTDYNMLSSDSERGEFIYNFIHDFINAYEPKPELSTVTVSDKGELKQERNPQLHDLFKTLVNDFSGGENL